ncbi:conserved hypothetical protein [Burkholderiales bacterium 8X]|nr:conserved hypothetical protein [Burkholderiales bacterium 8X]
MTKNEGAVDRTIRIALGGTLVVLAAMDYIGVWGWIGLVPLATGLAGSCPVYSIFGIRTCPAPR